MNKKKLNTEVNFGSEDDFTYTYFWDSSARYCFSLTRRDGSEEIEIMVSDQINEKIFDLDVTFSDSSMLVNLSKDLATKLDGHTEYELSYSLSKENIQGLKSTLTKIFFDKRGLSI